MNPTLRNEYGAVLVMTAVIVVLLLGVGGGFALDMGRIYLLRTEMQNAVDAAARAGAWELNGKTNARTRAVAAVKDLLEHKAHFAKDRELLEKLTYLPDSPQTSPIVFYSWIGSSDDPDVTDPPGYCATMLEGTWLPDQHKCLAESDIHAHYVGVKMDPELVGDPDLYTVDLFFLPVLEIFIDDVARVTSVRADAVAGRHFLMCKYPPVMFCNPFEPAGETFASAVNPDRPGGPLFEPGNMLILKYQSGSWAPGNFAFLLPKDRDGEYEMGARALGEYMANPASQGCTPPRVCTRTGSVQSWPIWGWNTRFDLYEKFGYNDYPPAPDVIEYPQDSGFVEIGGLDDRFGNGIWDANAYWAEYHNYHAAQKARPLDWDDWTRWDVYNWEISEGYPPCDPDGQDNKSGTPEFDLDNITCPDPEDELPIHVAEDQQPFTYIDPSATPDVPLRVLDGLPNPEHPGFGSEPETVPERRILFTAVLDCDAQDIHGGSCGAAGVFAKFFILQRGTQGGGTSDIDYITEYLGLAEDEDENYHVEIQLYE